MSETSTKVSVVIPVFNEEEVVPELLRRVGAVLDAIPGGPHEIVVVNDGSSDGTGRLLEAAVADEPRLAVVNFSRNFGHQAAFSAGLDHATGDAVVMMDGDLQDVPEAIPCFLERFHQGYDVVFARRVGRKENPLLRFCYFAFYRLIAKMSRIDLPLDSGDFSLLSRRVVDQVKKMPERHRYLRGMRTWVGYRQTGVDVERDPRTTGASKYTFGGLIRLAIDGILSFSIAPLRATAFMGFIAVMVSFCYVPYALISKFAMHHSPQGFTTLIMALIFLFGLQFIVLGVIGEYIGRIYEQSKQRPQYIVDRVFRSGNLELED